MDCALNVRHLYLGVIIFRNSSQNTYLLRITQTFRKDCGSVARTRQSKSWRPRCTHIPSWLRFNLRILRLSLSGCRANHNTATASAKSDHNAANRSDDRRRIEKWHRFVHTKHHQIAQITRGSRFHRSEELANHLRH